MKAAAHMKDLDIPYSSATEEDFHEEFLDLILQ